MKTEISAGGLIVRKMRSRWQVLMVRDRNDVLTFPKGKIENKETKLQAAVREIAEEVGLHDLQKIALLPALKYIYKRNGSVDKTVHYFVFVYTGNEQPVPQHEEGLSDASWFTFPDALERTGYPESNRPLLLKTMKLLGIVQ